MPWTETEPMKERMRFVADAERGRYTMSELCERYGISPTSTSRSAAKGVLGARGPRNLAKSCRVASQLAKIVTNLDEEFP